MHALRPLESVGASRSSQCSLCFYSPLRLRCLPMKQKSWRRGAERRASKIEKQFNDIELGFPIYEGSLSIKKITGAARKAYKSWMQQRDRCHRPNGRSYKWYGERGIKVEYSSRQFIGWWLHQLKTKKDSLNSKKKLSCDRRDNDGNYCFSNIQLISLSENSKKQDRSCAEKPVIWHSQNGDISFKSIKDAAASTGLSNGMISLHCRNKTLVKKFSYEK